MSKSKNIQEALQLQAEISSYSDRIITIFRGFELCQQESNGKILRYTKIEKKDYVTFLCIVVSVLGTSTDEIRKQILERFKKSCENTNASIKDLRGFYQEIKSLSNITDLGFMIDYIPDERKVPRSKSPANAIVIKGNQPFQVECKTIHHGKGHPIHEMACWRFLKLLIASDEYKRIPFSSTPRTIRYRIDKKLLLNSKTDEVYTPETLFKKFQYDWINKKENIWITPHRHNSCILSDYYTSRAMNQDNTLFILDSDAENTYIQDLNNKIVKDIEDKINKGLVQHPIILYLETPVPCFIDKDDLLKHYFKDWIVEQIEIALKLPELTPPELRLDPETAAVLLKILTSKDGLAIMRIDIDKLRHTLDKKITQPVLVLLSNIQKLALGYRIMNEQMYKLLYKIEKGHHIL